MSVVDYYFKEMVAIGESMILCRNCGDKLLGMHSDIAVHFIRIYGNETRN